MGTIDILTLAFLCGGVVYLSGFCCNESWQNTSCSSGPGSICNNDADANSDGVISIIELINYIGMWKAGNATITELIDAIGKWKMGCV